MAASCGCRSLSSGASIAGERRCRRVNREPPAACLAARLGLRFASSSRPRRHTPTSSSGSRAGSLASDREPVMSSPRAGALPPLISRAGSPAPSRSLESSDSPSSRGDRPRKADPHVSFPQAQRARKARARACVPSVPRGARASTRRRRPQRVHEVASTSIGRKRRRVACDPCHRERILWVEALTAFEDVSPRVSAKTREVLPRLTTL